MRNTAMGELVASIAHEINQPLAAVITNSQAALRWLSHDEPNLVEVAAALQRANRDASLAGAVISRIRGFLRAGQIRRAPVDLARMLDQIVDGKPDAQEGRFRLQGVANGVANGPGVQWNRTNDDSIASVAAGAGDNRRFDEDQVTTVVAIYKMNQ